MHANELINELKRKHKIDSDTEVAVYLGMTPVQLANWKKSPKQLSARQIANAID